MVQLLAPATARWATALPAAFGAKLARPDAPVVALIGDGGLQFTIGELATAVELGAAACRSCCGTTGATARSRRYMADRGIPQIGVDIYTPDFQTIARGFGCRAQRAESLEDLRQHLRQARQAAGPTLIEVQEEAALAW